MVTVPPEWEAYARLQGKVARSRKADHRVEALEAAMNKMLENGNSLDEQAAITAAKTAARKERHRVILRQRYLPHEEPATNLVPDIEARSLCAQVKKVITPNDWSMMASVAAGYSQRDVATLFGATQSAIGVRIFRARRDAKAALPPQLLAELEQLLAA